MPQQPGAECEHLIRLRSILPGRWRTLPPDCDGGFDSYYRVKRRNTKPQVPVLHPRQPVGQKADPEEAGTAEYNRRARNEVPFHQFPEDVTLRARVRVRAAERNTIVVAMKCLTIDEPCLGSGI